MSPAVVTAVLLLVCILDPTSAQPDALSMSDVCRGAPLRPCGDEGWNYLFLNQRCAKYFKSPKTFQEAQEHCRSLNSELVSLHSVDDMYYLLCFTWSELKERTTFWIGAERSEGGFRFTDGSDFNFSSWDRQEPNSYSGEEGCVESNFNDWGLWNDARCSEEKNFVCVKKK